MALRGIFQTKSNKETYTTITSFTDIAKFRQLLAQLLTLTLSIASSFSTYFKDTYCTHEEQWATWVHGHTDEY